MEKILVKDGKDGKLKINAELDVLTLLEQVEKLSSNLVLKELNQVQFAQLVTLKLKKPFKERKTLGTNKGSMEAFIKEVLKEVVDANAKELFGIENDTDE